MGFFGKIIGALKKTKDNISGKLSALFAKGLGDDFYDELEEILISADISVKSCENKQNFPVAFGCFFILFTLFHPEMNAFHGCQKSYSAVFLSFRVQMEVR